MTPDARPAMHLRMRRGLRFRSNWLQLLRFAIVGASGYVVNLAVFAAVVGVTGAHHLVAATAAFLVAVANNFWLNRAWTFRTEGPRSRFQATRYFTVSVAAFVVAAALLLVLVDAAGLPEVLAQAIAIVIATPVNFAGNKMWTFNRHSAAS